MRLIVRIIARPAVMRSLMSSNRSSSWVSVNARIEKVVEDEHVAVGVLAWLLVPGAFSLVEAAEISRTLGRCQCFNDR